METLGKANPERVIDLLSERLTYERAGVKLYDAVLKKVAAARLGFLKRVERDLAAHRDEEAEHASWCEEQIRALGGDPEERTGRALLVETETQGLQEVIFSDSTLQEMFHALLAAELADNAGWALLVGLADQAGDEAAKAELEARLKEEEDHLRLVHRLLGMFVRAEVLGQT